MSLNCGIKAPMSTPCVLSKQGCRGRTGGRQQRIPQPGCITSLKREGLSKNPSFMTAAWMRWVKAIIGNLANIEYSQLRVRQKVRHVRLFVSRTVPAALSLRRWLVHNSRQPLAVGVGFSRGALAF
jgi:hypothetical protein